MANINIPNTFVSDTIASADEVNANFDEFRNKFNTYAVQTDVAKTITATHTFSAGLTVSAGATEVQSLTVNDGLLIAASGGAGFNPGVFRKHFDDGLQIGGIIGATNDFAVYNPAGTTPIIRIPTGTSGVTFAAGIVATTGVFSGNLDALTFRVAATQVVGARRTGWTDQTATASRANLGASPTVGGLASFCRALYDDLKTHGLIGN